MFGLRPLGSNSAGCLVTRGSSDIQSQFKATKAPRMPRLSANSLVPTRFEAGGVAYHGRKEPPALPQPLRASRAISLHDIGPASTFPGPSQLIKATSDHVASLFQPPPFMLKLPPDIRHGFLPRAIK